jgi:hypothetical protein
MTITRHTFRWPNKRLHFRQYIFSHRPGRQVILETSPHGVWCNSHPISRYEAANLLTWWRVQIREGGAR